MRDEIYFEPYYIVSSPYESCRADNYLTSNTGDHGQSFRNGFDEKTISFLIKRSISTYNKNASSYYYIDRDCYIYSYGDFFLEESDNKYFPEFGIFKALMINKETEDPSESRIAKINGNPSWYTTRSIIGGINIPNIYSITDYGELETRNDNHNLYRPVLNFHPLTPISYDEQGNIYIK